MSIVRSWNGNLKMCPVHYVLLITVSLVIFFYSAVGDQYEVSAKIENMVKIRQMEILHPSPLTDRLQKVINTSKFAMKCSYRRILKSS